MTTLATSKLRLQFQAHTNAVTDIKIKGEDEDQIIYTSSRDKTIKGWTISKDMTGEEFSRLKKTHRGHGGFVTAFDLSKTSDYRVSVGRDNMVRAWPTSPTDPVLKAPHQDRPYALLTHLVTVREGNQEKSLEYIFTGGKSGALHIWNSHLELKKSLVRQDNPGATITTIKAVPKNPMLILCAYTDGAVVTWNIESEMVENIMKASSILDAVTVSPDGSICATAGRDRSVLLWDLKGQNNQYQISAGEPVHSLEFAFSAYWLAAGMDNSIAIWDIIEKEIVIEIPNPEESKGFCTAMCWADRFTLIAGYSDGLVRKYVFNVE
ncbi:guanine nucleotide-binding protein subunit beta-2-like 1 protein [Nematocida homosporus]|uniref:guanine nucleotide-binding protein subunit beta-2-like 1 protein n=1 Tax=Nematocida homosporus TaxID=1912981 RepID=UPI00222050AA|nr:guanine nucleotide-binding protein subunit beta-2-like 1 protein [Nematocida homosporus]KAI5186818.1 guanine nucleotide-binding protein subunit beta-2-like 1 protein [Nematocida homosporus]